MVVNCCNPSTQEAEANNEFEVSLGYIVRPSLEKQNNPHSA
jgi:hypothetical protein